MGSRAGPGSLTLYLLRALLRELFGTLRRALKSIMGTAFATLEKRLGTTALARLANATAVVLAGGAVLEGIYAHNLVDAPLGASGMQAREVLFTCNSAAAATAGIEIGSRLQITYGTVVALWEVARLNEVFDLGHVELTLKAPPP